jgi:phage gp29-like protein
MTTALARRPAIRDTRNVERETTVLDQYGRPIGEPQIRRIVAAPNPRGQQTYNSHPVVGLSVETLMSYYRSAESGAPIRQMDVFDDLMERHAEMRGMFEERRDDVAGCDWAIVPPPDRSDKPSKIAAQALQEYLQYNVTQNLVSPGSAPSSCFRTWLEHQLSAVPFGYACTALVWDYVEKYAVPVQFEPVAQRRFASPGQDRTHELWLIDGTKSPFDLIELQAGLWSCTRLAHRNPYAAGLMRSCAWWVMFALLGFKQWQVFGDMFGLPLSIGYYEEGASKPSREKLEEAVRMIGQDGYAVLSSLTEIVIKETARGGDSSTVYPLIMAACDKQITKLITGGTLNTDVSSTGAGSYNAATVHASRLYAMKRRDSTRIEDAFAESIGRAFVAWNGFDRAGIPRLKMKIIRDDLQRAQTLAIVGSVIGLDEMQIREEFNCRVPADGKGVKFEVAEKSNPNRERKKEDK